MSTNCPYSGCNHPEGECLGYCLSKEAAAEFAENYRHKMLDTIYETSRMREDKFDKDTTQ